MLISAIVAMASNRVIGNRGGIPWKIPGEQKMFKEITLGHSVIMGRRAASLLMILTVLFNPALRKKTKLLFAGAVNCIKNQCLQPTEFT
jgi:dihydrofolate reductase